MSAPLNDKRYEACALQEGECVACFHLLPLLFSPSVKLADFIAM
jgi:hypothetical protein